jgi:hypothetical protein
LSWHCLEGGDDARADDRASTLREVTPERREVIVQQARIGVA